MRLQLFLCPLHGLLLAGWSLFFLWGKRAICWPFTLFDWKAHGNISIVMSYALNSTLWVFVGSGLALQYLIRLTNYFNAVRCLHTFGRVLGIFIFYWISCYISHNMHDSFIFIRLDVVWMAEEPIGWISPPGQYSIAKSRPESLSHHLASYCNRFFDVRKVRRL